MKILFFSDNFPPERNAAATRVYERAVFWKEWGHDVTVITCAPNFPEGKVFEGYENKWRQVEYIDGIRVVRVKTFITANAGIKLRILDFLSYMVTAFFFAFFEKRPDIVTSTSPQFFCAVSAWAHAKLRFLPYVFELGDLWPASITALGVMKKSLAIRILERIELFLYRQSKRVIALTNAFKEDLIARGIDAEKIDVIINGVDSRRYKPMDKDQGLLSKLNLREKFIITYIGTHGTAHALSNVLETAEHLIANEKVHFVLVGPGAEREMLMNKVAEKGLKNVTMVESQPKSEMPKYWSLSDLALVHLKDTPLFEGVIPSKMFEAMCMGIGLLMVLPKGEASTIVEKEQCGVWVPPENPASLAEQINHLEKNRYKVDELSKAAFKASKDYSRELQAKKVIETYQMSLS